MFQSSCEITRAEAGGAFVVTCAGEIDLTLCDMPHASPPSSGAFNDALRDAARSGLPVTVDLRGVSFLDSAGLAALMDCARAINPARLTVRSIYSSQPHKVLMLGRWDTILTILTD